MKKALLVGLNAYATQKSLRGCINDAAEMKDLLTAVFHFDEVAHLSEAAVSKAALLPALANLFRAEPGETDGVRLFFFAGHGSRVFDLDDDEVDRIDENICLPDYDSTNPATYILDDEFAAILRTAHEAAPSLRRFVILDSCHSGTATRDVEAQLTWLEIERRVRTVFNVPVPEDLDWPADDPRRALIAVARQADDPPGLAEALDQTAEEAIAASQFGADGVAEPATHLLFSGCSAAQTCKDVAIDGGYHGIFTHTLCRLARTRPDLTWAELQQRVDQAIAKGYGQSPQLEGPAAMKSASIFR